MNYSERQQKQKRFDEIKHTIRKIEGILEVALLTFVYYIIWRNLYTIPRFYFNGKYVLCAVYAFLVFILFFYGDSFKFGHIKLDNVVVSQWIAIMIVNMVTYFQLCLIENTMITPVPMLLLSGIDFVVTGVLCFLYTTIYHSLCIPRNMLLIYGSENAISLKSKMETRGDKYQISHTLNANDVSYEKIIAQIPEYDAVVINDVDAETTNRLLTFCYQNSIRTYLVPKISDIIYSGGNDITLFDTPLKLVKGRGLTLAQRLIKRIFDLIFSMIALIPLLLITVVVGIAIKIEDGGAVFYRQKRITKDGREFEMVKFRSMCKDAESAGIPQLATENDPRITKVGKFIRACRIDELPQIFNILKGEMSIVGPRPERKLFYEEFEKTIPEFELRTKVKGGLTGFAQVYGKYNTPPLDKLKLDLMYIENYSILLDIKIIFMTLRILFEKESTEGVDKENSILKTNSSPEKK